MNSHHPTDPAHRPIRDAHVADTAAAAAAAEQAAAVERASAFAIHGDPSTRETADPSGTEHGKPATVEFVRATDLAGRAGRVAAAKAHGVGRSAQDSLYSAVRNAVREQANRVRERVAEREAQLTPEDTHPNQHHQPVIRQGVSR